LASNKKLAWWASKREKIMIKQILIKVPSRIIQGIILIIAFFIITLVFNDCYYFLRKSLKPWLPVEIDNHVIISARFDSNLLKGNKDYIQLINSTQKQLKSELLRNKNIEFCTFALHGVEEMSFRSSDIRNNNVWAYLADKDMMRVFDIKLEEGRWYDESDTENTHPAVVLTRDHARELGITHLSANTIFEFKSRQNNIDFRVVGITEPIGKVSFQGRRHPFFVPLSYKDRGLREHLNIIIKPKPNANIDQLIFDLEKQFQVKGWNQYFYRYHVESLNQRMHHRFVTHFRYFRIEYGIIGILLCFIAIILLGSIWQQVNKRMVEIGIRRAIGAPRQKVLSMIISEAFVFLLIVSSIAGIIYFNIYDFLRIEYYLISPLIAILLISIVVIISALVPAWRASIIHPVEALADE
jgi:ABC-type antimicrobial peptide transport system permease subunit